jgi:type I restriction enzyme M protein
VRTGNGSLDLPVLEGWLWEAACVIRGPVDAPKFKDFILPLVFMKRLSDVFEDEVVELARDFGTVESAQRLVDDDHKLVRLYIPELARWAVIAKQTVGLGEHLTDAVRAVARENPRLQGVIDVIDFNATTAGQRVVDDQRLAALVQVLGKYRLGLHDVEPDLFGRAYEYLLRKFAEGQGQSAGEFYTPREVAILMARVLDPHPGMSVYDPCCGSGGLLIKCHLRLLEKFGVEDHGHHQLPQDVAPLKLFGQEINPGTFAIARMNALIHDMDGDIAVGDTMARPRFTDDAGSLARFDLVAANPMWRQRFSAESYEQDPFGRFRRGTPPESSADWAWVQHMWASLKPNGRMAVVLDTGAVSRGSGNEGSSKERGIRQRFVDEDLIEAVFQLPTNLFYNTTSPGIIMVLNSAKEHPGELLLTNASRTFKKGRPKNYLRDDHIDSLASTYESWSIEEGLSALTTSLDVARGDYNLLPSRFVSGNGAAEVPPVEEALLLLEEAQEDAAEVEGRLQAVLRSLAGGS